MIEDEQRELADYIKSVHLSLRCKSRQIGAELAWRQHVENEEVLRNYASCMKTLAENYWSVNNRKDKENNLCRIQWMVNAIREYFETGGLFNEIAKERRKLEWFVSRSIADEEELKIVNDSRPASFEEPYALLDVGSCYDPFSAFPCFKTFPVDLCPAIPSVKKCDFTKLVIQEEVPEDWFRDGLTALPRGHFDIVVFSLFLEYLPSPEQRYISCELAYAVLKDNGLLLIATPDSKHESANAGLMKAWKIALARIGFVRIKLEKLRYIYCMAFRKAISRTYPVALYNIDESDEERRIAVPQDFVDYKTEEIPGEACKENEESVREKFEILPFS